MVTQRVLISWLKDWAMRYPEFAAGSDERLTRRVVFSFSLGITDPMNEVPDDTLLQHLVTIAECGNRDALAYLNWTAGNLLYDGKPLPLPLAKFVGLRLMKNGFRPEMGKTPEFVRDYFVIGAVNSVCELLGLKPTRNREQKATKSACSVVAAAFKGTPLQVSERAIEEIWSKRYRFRTFARPADHAG
jgi:hypothetical protein